MEGLEKLVKMGRRNTEEAADTESYRSRIQERKDELGV